MFECEKIELYLYRSSATGDTFFILEIAFFIICFVNLVNLSNRR